MVGSPYSVPGGSMAVLINDTPVNGAVGFDAIEIGIISDSNFKVWGCDFSLAIIGGLGYTRSWGKSGPVFDDTYDLIVSCFDPVTPCDFDLTWSATY